MHHYLQHVFASSGMKVKEIQIEGQSLQINSSYLQMHQSIQMSYEKKWDQTMYV